MGSATHESAPDQLAGSTCPPPHPTGARIHTSPVFPDSLRMFSNVSVATH